MSCGQVLERERRSCAELLEETLSEQVPGAPTAKSLAEQKWVRLSLVRPCLKKRLE